MDLEDSLGFEKQFSTLQEDISRGKFEYKTSEGDFS